MLNLTALFLGFSVTFFLLWIGTALAREVNPMLQILVYLLAILIGGYTTGRLAGRISAGSINGGVAGVIGYSLWLFFIHIDEGRSSPFFSTNTLKGFLLVVILSVIGGFIGGLTKRKPQHD
jgi:putative membrane protein (TIGR04086 family)